MNYEVLITPEFKRLFKKLLKKYPSLKNDLQSLISKLEDNPELGVSLGNNIFKIRLAISSKGKGKSGGARVITFLVYNKREIYLVHIYDKSQLDNIRKEQIIDLLKSANLL